MKSDAFICYAKQDKTSADEVCLTLEEHDIRCWIAPRDVRPGRDFTDEITLGIRDTRVMVIIFSGRTNESRHVKSETRAAFDSGKALVPFRIEDVVPKDGFDHLLGNAQWIDAFTPPRDAKRKELADTVRLLLDETEDNSPPAALPRKTDAFNVAKAGQPFFVGTWIFEGYELGEATRIIWTIGSNGTTEYNYLVDGQLQVSPIGRWTFSAGLFFEEFDDGHIARSLMRQVDHDAFELTIVDNDIRLYRGQKRLYRRFEGANE